MLTFKILDVKVDQTVEVIIEAIVKDRSVFAKDQTIHCNITNIAKAEANGEWDEDNTKICVQTEVLGVTTLPQAGPEDYLPLLPFALIGITGVAMLFKQK